MLHFRVEQVWYDTEFVEAFPQQVEVASQLLYSQSLHVVNEPQQFSQNHVRLLVKAIGLPEAPFGQ